MNLKNIIFVVLVSVSQIKKKIDELHIYYLKRYHNR